MFLYVIFSIVRVFKKVQLYIWMIDILIYKFKISFNFWFLCDIKDTDFDFRKHGQAIISIRIKLFLAFLIRD